jgi:TonB-dependent starch-binding outer membrane protein SusC
MKWLVIGIGMALWVPQTASAQSVGQVSGMVTSAAGTPLVGASVAIAGMARGDVTGADGRYTITAVPTGSRTVRATFAGYTEATRTVTVTAGQTATLNIQLAQQAVQLEEIVAIGYGTARRRDVTGSIGTVTAEDLATEAAPVASVAGALLGRSPGVQVVSNSATPGAGAEVRIRGTNSISATSSPLYVVDGIPISPGTADSGTPLNSIDPNNIESVQILKDASSTSIYGARGANGVVLITTKRGTRGGNQVTLESSYGVQKASKFIPALNAQQFMILRNEGRANSGSTPLYTQAQIDAATTYDYPRALLQNLDWQRQQNHALTFSGGSAQTRYLVAGNYVDQEGLILNSGFQRIGGRVNLDQTISSKLRIGTSLSGTRLEQRVNGGESTGTGANSTGLTTAVQYDPSVLPFDESTGTWNQRVVLNENFLNPITESTGRNQPTFRTAILGSVFGEYDLMEGLMLRSTLGGNFNYNRVKSYSPSWIGSGNGVGVASQESSERRELTSSTTLQYRRELGPGNLDALVGADVQTSDYEEIVAEAQGFPVDDFSFNNLTVGSIHEVESNTEDWVLLSQLARLNYNLLDRYLFTLTGRRDGSSRFGANNKWAFFPSAAFAWQVTGEPFMQNQALFSDLKLRLSYGRTGNQAITEYQSLARLGTAFAGQGTTTNVAVLAPENAAPNPDLKWETQDQYNLGADFGVLDNRVRLTVDAYQSETSNLLLSRTLPRTSGYQTQLQNVGAVRNRGLETSLSTINWDGDRFRWETTLNLALNRNEVVSLYGGLTQLAAGSSTQVGEPLNTFVGFRVLGLYQQGDQCAITPARDCTPGEYKLLDADGNGVINNDDRVNLGNPQADFYGGFNSSMSYGPVSLDAFFNFSKGNEINNTSLRYAGLVGGASNERADRALQRWTPTNTGTDVPRANILRPNDRTYSTYIEDGSFLRLQTLTLGYQVPAGLVPGTQAARVVVTGQNLWLTTRYSGYDPENQASDPGGYPRARTWNFGLNLTF